MRIDSEHLKNCGLDRADLLFALESLQSSMTTPAVEKRHDAADPAHDTALLLEYHLAGIEAAPANERASRMRVHKVLIKCVQPEIAAAHQPEFERVERTFAADTS